MVVGTIPGRLFGTRALYVAVQKDAADTYNKESDAYANGASVFADKRRSVSGVHRTQSSHGNRIMRAWFACERTFYPSGNVREVCLEAMQLIAEGKTL